MNDVRIPHKAWVLVADGRRALVLQNEGSAVLPDLRALVVFKDEITPATSQLGTSAPGRKVDHLSGRRASVEQTDWHDIGEHRFAQSVASVLCSREREGEISALVVVAPPRTLAELRDSFTDSLKARIVAEVDKDLTRHPIEEIEHLLSGGGKRGH